MTAQTAQKQNGQKKVKTAITPTRQENFPEWYQNVIKAADMAENAPVRGCMIIKPYGYAVWELFQRELDSRIKDEGVKNAYFPLLIPLSYIAKEAEHIDGFAKECAVVTHHRLEVGPDGKGLVPAGELAEPMIIRPTSETIIGETIAKWVNSYRDLPLKLNQWANVMRWEMRPRLFLRTAEFLWQEGHNAFATADEANADARRMLEVYAEFSRNVMAIPVFEGEKTPEERFPGAAATYTIEAVLQDGKALQSGTSHDLGQTFSRSANIRYQSAEGGEEFAWTTSWGMSSRMIGGLIMTHGDDDGMRMPPKVAPHQVVIIPIIHDDADRAKILEYAETLARRLKDQSIRVELDASDKKTPDKLWGSIKQGVPVRVEIGRREMEEGNITHTRRDIGRNSKATESVDIFCNKITALLDEMQDSMYQQALKRTESMVHDVKSVDEAHQFFAAKDSIGQVRFDAAFLQDEAFEKLMQKFSVTPRCLPFADDGKKVIVGKAY